MSGQRCRYDPPIASEMVREFHEVYRCAIRDTPTIDVPEVPMRLRLIREELKELEDALTANDIVEVADALGDLLYVVHGAAITFGIPLDDVVAEIHRSNLTKRTASGAVLMASDGKILKSELYEPPNLRPILFPDKPWTCNDCGGELPGPNAGHQCPNLRPCVECGMPVRLDETACPYCSEDGDEEGMPGQAV